MALAGVAVALPVLNESLTDRPARLLIGDPFPSGQELVLAVVLLAAARGLLLRRRTAYYIVLVLTLFSALDAFSTMEFGRLLMLAAGIFIFYRFRRQFTAEPARVRTAVRAGLITYGAAVVYALAVMILDRHSITPTPSVGEIGREILAGLTGSGNGPLHFGGSVDRWFDVSLSILGGGGLLAMLMTVLTPAPAPPAGDETERAEAARLVDDRGSDTLAPFVLRSDKSYVFSPDRRAVIGYRVLFGVAVAGGDPAGDPRSYPAAIAEFAALATRSGWRMAVLGARGDLLDLWHEYGMRSIGFGDEVLLYPGEFGLAGRKMRNVRQAIQRTENSGITTEIAREGALPPARLAELRTLATDAMGGADERGFSMNLDSLLTGRHADAVIVIAYDGDGAPAGFQRYLPSASGHRLSLDAMRRAPGSANGLNERMIADIMAYAAEHEVDEVSLNFAAFRELLDAPERGALEQGGYHLIHLLDPFIKVESLYLFNRKFRPSYVPRSVVFPSWASIVPVALALLMLEFGHSGNTAAPPPAEPEQVPEEAYPVWPYRPMW